MPLYDLVLIDISLYQLKIDKTHLQNSFIIDKQFSPPACMHEPQNKTKKRN